MLSQRAEGFIHSFSASFAISVRGSVFLAKALSMPKKYGDIRRIPQDWEPVISSVLISPMRTSLKKLVLLALAVC